MRVLPPPHLSPESPVPAAVRLRPLAAILVLGAVLACNGDDSLRPAPNPLQGLNALDARDSTGTLVPPPPAGAATAGYFRGTVLGPSAPGSGNDSLETAPRVVGARLTAYPIIQDGVAAGTIGAALAEIYTDADGRFTLPLLPGGEYVVTVTPPTGSPYGGVFVTATAHAESHVHPWWVVLWLK